jgi:hypothetical protein
MTEKSHYEQFVDYIMSDDDSELGRMKAERDYALHALEREIAIAHQAQARVEALEAALETILDEIDSKIQAFLNRAALDKDAGK